MFIISVWLMEMTSYLDTNIISIIETFSESLVKIRRRDVIWRHVTSFLNFMPKKCWRQQKWGPMGHPLNIFRRQLSNSNKMRGQPFFYDLRLKRYLTFPWYVGFLWRHHKIADISRNNDVTGKIMTSFESSWVTL